MRNGDRRLFLTFTMAACAVAISHRTALAAKADVEFVSSVSAVAAGQPFDLALRFRVDEGWHIYWKNPGDSGMAPKITWTLPPGFSAGELRFPLPKRHVGRANLVTNILEGKPVLIVSITPPKSLNPGENIRIAADINWLVCKEQCLKESKSISLSLPTATDANPAAPANAALFKRARRSLAVPGGKGKFVTVTPSFPGKTLSPSAQFTVDLTVTVRKGFHIQSDKPRLPGLIATELFMDPADGVYYDPPKFPEPLSRTIPRVGVTTEFEHTITIHVPGETDEELVGDSRQIGGLFVYQACSLKTGTCFPREGVAWSLSVPIGLASAATGDQTHAQAGQAATPPAVNSAPTTSNVAPPTQTENAITNANTHASQANASTQDLTTGVPEEASEPQSWSEQAMAALKRLGVPGLLLACFIYGLSLNATPCVLPLLSIKVLGFVQQSHESRKKTFALAVAFGAGVLLLFLVLGFLAARGKNVLQNPFAVIALAAIVMALALSMLGVYTLQVPTTAAKLDASIHQEGVIASFGKGALAPVLGFACTGPLLAAAFGWATKQPPKIAVLAFLSTGMGMASPYVLLGAFPGGLRFLPKPGQWMITFERIMGFVLLAMVVWLMSPLVTLTGPAGLQWTTAFLVAVGMGCWMLGQIDFSMPAAKRWNYRAGAAAVVCASAAIIYGGIFSIPEAVAHQRDLVMARSPDSTISDADHIKWQQWSPEAVEQAVQAGKTVFVDFTASYCTGCKANKALAINTPQVRQKLKELDIVTFRGDFSFGDETIFETLQKFDRAGVPLNLIYPAARPDQPIVLRPSLTKTYLLQKLEQAGPSLPASHAQSS